MTKLTTFTPFSSPNLQIPLTTPGGNITPYWGTWLLTLFNKVGGNSGEIATTNATYITNTPDLSLTNSQAISGLESGFLRGTQVSGALNSTGSVYIRTQDLTTTGVVAGSYGAATSAVTLTVGVDGRIISITASPITGITPGGSAGGDLVGTYPNPTVNKKLLTNTFFYSTVGGF